MVDFQNEILLRVDDLNDYLKSRFGNDFSLQIKKRNSRGIIGFYWRVLKQDNKNVFRRLTEKPVIEILNSLLDKRGRLEVLEIEEELLCLNANMRISKLIEQNIEQLITDQQQLSETQLHNLGL